MSEKAYYSTKRVTAEPEERGNVQGMALTYQDGYKSWCPLDVFERDYQPVTAMSFGHALTAILSGRRVARQGWNGKAMWIALSGPVEAGKAVSREIDAAAFWSPHNASYARSQGGRATVLPCLTMKTATGEILMGWLASQTDMLADDWMIVEDAA